MVEAPEALYLSEQLNNTIKGKKITGVIARHTPHKFAFFYGNPEEDYARLLIFKTVDNIQAQGGMLEIIVGETYLILSDGINLRYYSPGEKLPPKHQLLIIFEDESCLVVSVRMYGGLWCFHKDSFDAPIAEYYKTAKSKPQVMSDTFSLEYFLTLINGEAMQNKTLKAFLATEQTIPGLGNGVLQDILYNARIHPKTKIKELSDIKKTELYYQIKFTLVEMYKLHGRNTETNIFGVNGNYIPFLSKDTAGKECPRCDGIIKKECYLGGSIYFCKGCQE